MDEEQDTDPEVRRQEVRSISVEAKVFGDYIVVSATEWANGDGWDVSVGDKPVLQVHHSEFGLLKLLFAAMEVDDHSPKDDPEEKPKRKRRKESQE